MSLSIVLTRYTKFPDFFTGTIVGIGIGIILLGFKNQNRHPA